MASRTLLLLCIVALFRPFWGLPMPVVEDQSDDPLDIMDEMAADVYEDEAGADSDEYDYMDPNDPGPIDDSDSYPEDPDNQEHYDDGL